MTASALHKSRAKAPAKPAAEAAGKPARLRRKPANVKASSPAERYPLLIRYRPAATAPPAAPPPLETIQLELDDAGFYPDVHRWRYVVANRRRITRDTRDTLADDVTLWLTNRSGLAADDIARHVQAMASAGFVEVVVPFEKEGRGWAARLFPWEATLALATRPWRKEGESFTVVRYLKSTDKKPLPRPMPSSLLLVRSAPSEFSLNPEFERECEMVALTLQPQLAGSTKRLNEPDRAQLQATIADMAPAIVHLVGNQSERAMQRLNMQRVEPQDTDGFILRMAERGYDTVAPEVMARLLSGGNPAPLLLAASTCYSASRLCALTVGFGARYAIGFFDTLSDADALLFFGQFYREWSQDWDILRAFDSARAVWLAQQAGAQIGGVVLWSRHSLLDPDSSVSTPQATVTTTPSEAQATVDDLTLVTELNLDLGNSGVPTKRTSLNYSLLHNDRSPFRTFFLDKPLRGRLPPLHVEVLLEVGNDNCRCRFAQDLPEAKTGIELAPRIRLPLVAGLLRQCTESLRTNLYVRVRCGERLLLESSERVTVLPADEWRDDGEDHRWLPSFVLPRDPAVLKVIGSAQRYLRTLLDDCTVGFDGYQQLAYDDSNAAAVVDPQVQAIWAALQHDLPLNYINPPPSYTSRSQRLRSPSEVFRGQAATCIDLALLFASCLEFVGIYPVLFLIEGHAFPGYWRSDKAWWRMKQFHFDAAPTAIGEPAVPVLPTTASTSISGGQSEGWMFDGVGNLVEMLRYVQDGSLVPFESTFVAAQRSFYASLEEGSARLHPDTFDSMVDIQSARGANVTPLPLFDKFE